MAINIKKRPGRPRKNPKEQELQAQIYALKADANGMEAELKKEREKSAELVEMMAQERINILQFADALFEDMQNALNRIEKTTGTVMLSDVEYHTLLVRRMLHCGLTQR